MNNLGWKGHVGIILSNLLLKADPTQKSGPKWICLCLLCILRLRTQIFTASALLASQLGHLKAECGAVKHQDELGIITGGRRIRQDGRCHTI